MTEHEQPALPGLPKPGPEPTMQKRRPGRHGRPWADIDGRGPSWARCRDCRHVVLQGGVAGRYFKCALRPITGGPGTDIRLKDRACFKFEGRQA